MGDLETIANTPLRPLPKWVFAMGDLETIADFLRRLLGPLVAMNGSFDHLRATSAYHPASDVGGTPGECLR